MKLKLTDKVKRNKEVIFKEFDGLVYILDSRNATIHTLNRTASFIWRKLKKPTSLASLVTSMCQSFEVGKKTAEKDICLFLSGYLEGKYIIKDK